MASKWNCWGGSVQQRCALRLKVRAAVTGTGLLALRCPGLYWNTCEFSKNRKESGVEGQHHRGEKQGRSAVFAACNGQGCVEECRCTNLRTQDTGTQALACTLTHLLAHSRSLAELLKKRTETAGCSICTARSSRHPTWRRDSFSHAECTDRLALRSAAVRHGSRRWMIHQNRQLMGWFMTHACLLVCSRKWTKIKLNSEIVDVMRGLKDGKSWGTTKSAR
jgi:hypothetical protein